MAHADRKLKILLEKYRNAFDSSKNKEKMRLYSPVLYDVKEKFRGQPALIKNTGKVPMLSWLETPFWAEMFGFSLKDYYLKPDVYLENILKAFLFYFKEIDDDNILTDIIPIYLGEGFEATLFGMTQHYLDDVEPSLGSEALIKDKSELKNLLPIDFYSSGLMPLAHQFFEYFSSMFAPFGLKPGFVPWYHSPIHMVIFLRGFEQTFFDINDDPAFFIEMLSLVTEAEIDFLKKRKVFIGLSEYPKPLIADDYVALPNFPPNMYRDFIYESEKKLADEFGGICYWHDCGNATPYLDDVQKLPGIDLMHSGPYTPYEETAMRFSSTPIELHIKPKEECMDLSEEEMEKVLIKKIKISRKYNVSSFLIRVTMYRRRGKKLKEDLDILNKWTSVCKKVNKTKYKLF